MRSYLMTWTARRPEKPTSETGRTEGRYGGPPVDLDGPSAEKLGAAPEYGAPEPDDEDEPELDERPP